MFIIMSEFDDIEYIEKSLLQKVLENPTKKHDKNELFYYFFEIFTNGITQHLEPSIVLQKKVDFKYKFAIALQNLVLNKKLYVTNKYITTEYVTDDSNHIDETLPNLTEVSKYIVENNLLETYNFKNIPFDLVNSNNVNLVKKLLDNEPLIYFRKTNLDNVTPIQYINSYKMSNLFLEKIYLKVNKLELDNLEIHDELSKTDDEIQKLKAPLYDEITKDLIKDLILGLLFILLSLTEQSIKALLFVNLAFIVFELIIIKIYNK